MSNNRRKIEKCLAGGENHVTVHTGVNSNYLFSGQNPMILIYSVA